MERNVQLPTPMTHPRDEITDIDCDTALRRIVEGCVPVVRRRRAAAADGNAAAVHKLRIELTRLQSALLFFLPALADTRWRRVERHVRWLNSRLGKARDQDVLLQYASQRRYRKWARKSFGAIESARAKSYRKLAVDLHSENYQRVMRAIERQIRRSRPPGSGERRSDGAAGFSEARLHEWRNEIEQTGRRLRELGQKRQHRLRLKCKRYRYIVDSLLELGVGLTFQDVLFRDTAKQVHATLGDLRDLIRFKGVGDGRPPHYHVRKRKLLKAAESAFHKHT